jgi:branched-chain amino acid transport system substrate-binding protein
MLILWLATLVVSACGQAPAAPAPTTAPASTTAPAAPAPTAAPAAPAPTTAPAVPQGTPIKVGCSLPLTGAFADTGVWVERGYRQWAEDVNAAGGLLGRPVELTIYDDESKTENAVNLLTRLITVDQVDLVCGGYPGTAAAAQMAVAEKNQKVYVSMGGHMASFSQGFTYVFGAPPLMGQWWYEGLCSWLATLPEADRPKKAAIFTINNPVGAAILEPMPEKLGSLGIEIVVNERYDVPLTDAAPLVTKAKAAEADIFFANGSFPDSVQIVKAMRALDYNPKLIAQGVGSIIPAWVQELGKDGYYVFSGTAVHPSLPFEGIARLNEVAKAKYEAPVAPIYFIFGYAWMQALQRGVEGAQSLDQTAIRDWLKSNQMTTVAGTFTFDERGLPPPYNYLTQVIDGKAELIWPAEVRTKDPIYPKPAWGQ